MKREADAREVVDPGTICFWVGGSSLALPFGPTPISRANECPLITDCTGVNYLARVGFPFHIERHGKIDFLDPGVRRGFDR